MSAGRGLPSDFRASYTPLPKGTLLWHVYPSKYDARAFNPRSPNRFALVPPSGREMYYAGDSAECALWEAVLRNLVVEPKQPQHVDPAMLEDRSIAQVRLTNPVNILDLRSPHFRRLTQDADSRSEWQRLAVVPESGYGETHNAARELVSAAPLAAGLCWHSRQVGSRTAYVFYCPPLKSSDFDLIEITLLSDRWDLVDSALKIVGVERLGAAALSAELLEELPPEEADE